jgi:hypothetical protein
MATEVTRDMVRALAAANGLTIPEERLELVRRQYEGYLRTLEQLDALELPRETEPATVFALPVASAPPPSAPRTTPRMPSAIPRR